jgi:hypothetical protein
MIGRTGHQHVRTRPRRAIAQVRDTVQHPLTRTLGNKGHWQIFIPASPIDLKFLRQLAAAEAGTPNRRHSRKSTRPSVAILVASVAQVLDAAAKPARLIVPGAGIRRIGVAPLLGWHGRIRVWLLVTLPYRVVRGFCQRGRHRQGNRRGGQWNKRKHSLHDVNNLLFWPLPPTDRDATGIAPLTFMSASFAEDLFAANSCNQPQYSPTAAVGHQRSPAPTIAAGSTPASATRPCACRS